MNTILDNLLNAPTGSAFAANRNPGIHRSRCSCADCREMEVMENKSKGGYQQGEFGYKEDYEQDEYIIQEPQKQVPAIACSPISYSPSDPSSGGRYNYGWLEYNIPITISFPSPTPGAPHKSISIQAKGIVYYPAGGTEKIRKNTPFYTGLNNLPIVFIAHGNHATFSNPNNRKEEKCHRVSGFMPIPNHYGYTYLQRILAKAGIISVSVDCNLTNCKGLNQLNIIDRASLILASIKHFKTLNSTQGNKFQNKINLDKIGLLGHSRGAEAVLLVPSGIPSGLSLIGLTASNVKGIVSLAPTDTGIVQASPPGSAFMTILPAGDGDVDDNDGAKFYDKTSPIPFKAQLYIHNTNHNFFNRQWINDDSMGKIPSLLSRSQHERILAVYCAAFYRTVLLGENRWLPVLLGRIVMHSRFFNNIHISAEVPSAITIDDFEDLNFKINKLGFTNNASQGMFVGQFKFSQGPINLGTAKIRVNDTFFGDTKGMVAQAINIPSGVRSNLGSPKNLKNKEIWVRVAEVSNGTSIPPVPPVFLLGLQDNAKNIAYITSNDIGGLPRPFDRRSLNTGISHRRGGTPIKPNKTMLKTMRFPTYCFLNKNPILKLDKIESIIISHVRPNDLIAYDQIQIV
ncbi:MAG: hypothetical protein ACKVT2_22400 [Saprospiraceae bacterium]